MVNDCRIMSEQYRMTERMTILQMDSVQSVQYLMRLWALPPVPKQRAQPLPYPGQQPLRLLQRALQQLWGPQSPVLPPPRLLHVVASLQRTQPCERTSCGMARFGAVKS